MATTKTQNQNRNDLASEAPRSQPPAKQDRMTMAEFQKELKAAEDAIADILPGHVSKARFNACAIAAVQHNPKLLQCTRRSLFSAITKAAQDGILPDGRDGVILDYNVKVSKKDETPARYANLAQWQPMAAGLRKRARQLDDLLIDTQVIYKLDHFIWEQGDAPRIEHTAPKPFGSLRGEAIGAYAIFKHPDGVILHREVMTKEDIEKVRAKSKNPNSLMWTTFFTEGWRKTVLRRGIKSVPVSEPLESILRRDNDNFSLRELPARPTETSDGRVVPPRPQRSEFARQDDVTDIEPEEEEEQPDPSKQSQESGSAGEVVNKPVTAEKIAGSPVTAGHTQIIGTDQQLELPEEEEGPVVEEQTPAEVAAEIQRELENGRKMLEGCNSVTVLTTIRATVDEKLPPEGAASKAWNAECDARQQAIMAAKKPT